MDLTQLLNGFIIFWALGIICAGMALRLIIETKWSTQTSNSLVYQHVVLPLLPLFLGCCFGYFLTELPVPDLMASHQARTVYGAISGLLSSSLYKIVIVGMQKILGDQAKLDLPS